jgi:hypothetical protein
VILAALLLHWRSRASDLERFAPAAAQAFRDAADELDKALQSAEETVSLKEAAMLGGYSVDSLQRMVASGRIENLGRKGKPRIQRLKVPLKPGYSPNFLLTPSGPEHIDVSAIVASVTHKKGAR